MVMLLGVGTAPGAVSAEPAASGGNPRVQALLDELVANGASGALALVDDGDRTWRLDSGAARLEPYQPLRPAARFRVGSVTKSLVATVALQLVGRGRLGLDDPVERWLPGLVPNGEAITLRMLLNHTSGLFNYTDDQAWLEQLIANPTRRWTPRQLVAVATAHPPTFPPGMGWSYSNTGYIVAGLVLERATGRPLERLVRQRVIRRLGLARTSFPTRPGISGYHAHGYVPPSLSGQGYVDVTRLSPSATWAAGAVVSTAGDLRRFYAALFGGRLLRPALLHQMRTTVPVDPVFGYGLGVYSLRTACGTVWGHDGGVPGYLTFAYHDRGGRRHAIVMLPTEPDAALGSLLELTIDTAVCQMFGRVSTATRTQTSTPGAYRWDLLLTGR
jgi:D-alanyl-D-alanine carboxypeptidase